MKHKRSSEQKQAKSCLKCGRSSWKTACKKYGRVLTIRCRFCGEVQGS